MLQVQAKGVWLEGDAAELLNGKQKAAGLARYCNCFKGGANVQFTAKEDRERTWGIKSLTMILPGTELFLDYGEYYRFN